MGQASGPRHITQGDVEAVLNAFGTGGLVILQHSKVAEGSPADYFGTHGSIRPFPHSAWDRAHFCAEDWHVILAADIEGGDASFTYNDAQDIIQGLDWSFTLDGTALQTTRTPIKPFEDPGRFGFEVAYYFQQGRIMSPTDLSIGSHQLEGTLKDASGKVVEHGRITFFIDAPGTGACVSG
jgi:hypothetical protein